MLQILTPSTSITAPMKSMRKNVPVPPSTVTISRPELNMSLLEKAKIAEPPTQFKQDELEPLFRIGLDDSVTRFRGLKISPSQRSRSPRSTAIYIKKEDSNQKKYLPYIIKGC